jgi:hypothetical protein
MSNETAEQKALQTTDEVLKQVTGTEEKESIKRDKLLVIASNQDALDSLREQTKIFETGQPKVSQARSTKKHKGRDSRRSHSIGENQ